MTDSGGELAGTEELDMFLLVDTWLARSARVTHGVCQLVAIGIVSQVENWTLSVAKTLDTVDIELKHRVWLTLQCKISHRTRWDPLLKFSLCWQTFG